MHISVLLKEIIYFLNPRPNQNFIDCTLGSGGHSKAILEKIAPNGRLLAIDFDSSAIDNFQQYVVGRGLGERVTLTNDNFADLETIASKNNFSSVNGILLDLGFSSDELENSRRGFSFLKDEPLDMRFGDGEVTAADILNCYRFEELTKIFQKYGEERDAAKIARLVCEARKKTKIKTTKELVNIIARAKFGSEIIYPHHRIHPATKVFQALRIAVNKELENLENVLPRALKILKHGGRMAVISFHSLEDRIVKKFFKEQKQIGALNILTKKPVTASEKEIMTNPRSRSAKLRVAEKIL